MSDKLATPGEAEVMGAQAFPTAELRAVHHDIEIARATGRAQHSEMMRCVELLQAAAERQKVKEAAVALLEAAQSILRLETATRNTTLA